MPSRPPRIPAVTRHSVGIALAAPEVIGHRVFRMWLAGATPSRRDRDEIQRMWSEKLSAFHESWNAMMLEMFRANVALAFLPMKSVGWAVTPAGLAAHGKRTTMRVFAAGLAPVHRRAAANVKRLRRLQ